jgi:hypothetical protein
LPRRRSISRKPPYGARSVAREGCIGSRCKVYNYLAHGNTIAQASREARIACSYRPGMQSIDWAVPVVYARDADDALVEVREQPR